MKHYVVYHNVAKRGEITKQGRNERELFGILTDRPVTDALGAKIWLISGRGSPTSFRLHYVFTAEKSESGENEGHKHRVWGTQGLWFTPPISLNSEPWFADLRKTQFWSLGLFPLSSDKVIEGLLALTTKMSVANRDRSLASLAKVEAQLSAEVVESIKLNSAERLRRLSLAPRIPESFEVITTAYRRNPDVIAETLKRANGRCEKCGNPAPFLRKSDRTPYLEVHHWTALNEGGEDTVENAGALCPNCHRQAHHG